MPKLAVRIRARAIRRLGELLRAPGRSAHVGSATTPMREGRADGPIVALDRWTVTAWDWRPPETWTCPRCGTDVVTREPAPPCPRCLLRDDS